MLVTRFCPSPTGLLHVGNIRTALINYLYTKKQGGQFIVRIDDTDLKRSKEEYTKQIFRDLEWLGISYDKTFKQSERLDIYEKKKHELEKQGKIYPCFESEEDLNMQRKIQLSRGVPPIYDRSALKLTKEQIEEKIASGEVPYYRFLLSDDVVKWKDGIKGEIEFKSRAFSDPVVVRADGSPTYTFCSVIDDIEFKASDVIRGEDHITNTAVQINMFKSMGAKLPKFYHLALLKSKEGEISKRIGGFDVGSLKEAGIDPMAINSFLAKFGTSQNVVATKNMEDLINDFSLSHFSKGAVNYSERDILNLNHKVIGDRLLSEIEPFLKNLGISGVKEEFFEMVKENLTSFLDLKDWLEIFDSEFKSEVANDDKEFLREASEVLPEDITFDSYQNWIKEITNKTGKKGRELFHPLRLALTNKESGPELSKIVPLLGYDKVKKRLNG